MDARTRSYRYKISAVDSCGNESDLSDNHKTIYLYFVSNHLHWENYEGFLFGQYRVWRGTSRTNISVIDSIPSNIQDYYDTKGSNSDSLFYFLEVVHDGTCLATSGKKEASNSSYSSSKSNTAAISVLGIKQNSMNDKLSIYPNPTNGLLTMNINFAQKQNVVIRIFSLQGKLLSQEQISVSNGVFMKDIDLSSYAKGMYHIQLTTNEGIYNKKVVLE